MKRSILVEVTYLLFFISFINCSLSSGRFFEIRTQKGAGLYVFAPDWEWTGGDLHSRNQDEILPHFPLF